MAERGVSFLFIRYLSEAGQINLPAIHSFGQGSCFPTLIHFSSDLFGSIHASRIKLEGGLCSYFRPLW
jgi:hypothetical protein